MSESDGVVLVTGASGALGAAVVARCTSSGRRVVPFDRSQSAEAQVEAAGALTGAVLTAGAWRGGHRFHEAEAAGDYRAVMDANLESAQLVLRAVLPGMVARGRGSIVLIGSRSGVRPYDAPGDAAYAASKAALGALAQAVAAEVVGHGVRVNLVLPSTIDTVANRKAMPGADRSRWVTTDSLCDVIEFLLSDQARDVSGAAIPVYGRAGV
ncbi:MAG TPA: SDR family NAD(P)-dependent oxidoreductase [Polyangiaceae bacterium]|nr:SDR family NAD(P)-dependent oxidoreductase [Polyangiaceae bacterium]